MLDFSEPAVWWYITRSSAVVAWVLLTLSALWGILLKTRILRGADNPEWLKVVHRFLSSLAVLMVVTHMASLYLDTFVEFTVLDLLIPFRSTFEPFGVAMGVFGMWGMVLVWATALAMDRLPQKLWKGIHYLSYGSLFAVALHSGMVGSDVGAPWYTALSIILITATSLAVVIRIVITRRSMNAPTQPGSKAATSVAPTPVASDNSFLARVSSRRQVARDIVELTFTPVDSSVELDWDAGSHVTLHLGNGLERQYSLCGDPADARVLTIAVLDTHGEGGGSSWIHQNLREGSEIRVDFPLQNFPLRPHRRYQFVASGIGITPIRSMLTSLPASREWELVYLGRRREEMAFLDELKQVCGSRLMVHVSSEQGGRLDLKKAIDPQAHVYACGSEALLQELEAIVPAERLHLERFTPRDRSDEHTAHPVKVTWQPTGQVIDVPTNQTILEGLEGAGIGVNGSCRRGVCGSCEVRVISGIPAHLDSVMSDEEKDEVGAFYPCVSRAESETLVLGH
ncbi:MAG: 2Fe-2S iron-sulfur cluster-binding protein [Pontimonas sp.]